MKKWTLAAAALIGLGLIAQPLQAQSFGGQIVYGDDADLGIGARVEFPLSMITGGDSNGLFNRVPDDDNAILSTLVAAVTANYYLDPFECGDLDCSFFEINLNALYPVSIAEGFDPYVGAGIHWARAAVEYMGRSESNSEIGLNAVGGAKFELGGFAAFAEAILNLGGAEQLVLAFGVMLGGM